jgi:hypothetical protein
MGRNVFSQFSRSSDRVLLREGIPTPRFTAFECINKTVDVVTEFLELF